APSPSPCRTALRPPYPTTAATAVLHLRLSFPPSSWHSCSWRPPPLTQPDSPIGRGMPPLNSQQPSGHRRFSVTPLGKQVDSEKLILTLQNLPVTHPDSVRLHIPRALRLVYDIRNKRDAAHLADGIDPNMQDATLVVSVVDWILAEFIRLYHAVPADEARKIVETIVARTAPIVQDFDGFLKVLNPGLNAGDWCLVLLYQCGANGATFDQLSEWVRPDMRTNLKCTLDRLVHDKAFAHATGTTYRITLRGQKEIDARRLVELT